MSAELLHRAARSVSERAYRGDWVTALPDPVAFALAAWLRATVHEAEETELYSSRPTAGLTAAVDLARAILGEEGP